MGQDCPCHAPLHGFEVSAGEPIRWARGRIVGAAGHPRSPLPLLCSFIHCQTGAAFRGGSGGVPSWHKMAVLCLGVQVCIRVARPRDPRACCAASDAGCHVAAPFASRRTRSATADWDTLPFSAQRRATLGHLALLCATRDG